MRHANQALARHRRHVSAIQKNCEPGDIQCRRKQRQAAMDWAYDTRKI
jgi:hypothetical protein